jgi:predicted RecB family nuclease
MRFHVRSYRERRAVLFGSPPSVGDAFIALDLEYDAINPQLWLIGLYVIDPDRCEHVALWADDRSAERENLEHLARLLNERPDLPVVTWAGTSADLPALKRACDRLGVDGLLDELEDRHVDLFTHAKRILRLPIPELALGEVSGFFGMAKTSTIADGREAQALYARYLSRYSQRIRRRIKNELIAYNRDDLEALVETLRAIQELPIEETQLAA